MGRDLMSMPTEMHLKIMEFLDHPGQINLAATNKYFEALFPKEKVEKIKESLLCYEKCSLVVDTVFTKKKMLPCYTCMKVFDSYDHFAPFIGDGDVHKQDKGAQPSLASYNAKDRICATCLVRTRTAEVLDMSGWRRHIKGLVFDWGRNYGEARAYGTRAYHSDRYWVDCPKCNQIKRYHGDIGGPRRRYDHALMKGNMCATCYQPVRDQEDKDRRERKNARARKRYRQKKEQERKLKEAAERLQQEGPEAKSGLTIAERRALIPGFRLGDLFKWMDDLSPSETEGFMSGFDDMTSEPFKLLF